MKTSRRYTPTAQLISTASSCKDVNEKGISSDKLNRSPFCAIIEMSLEHTFRAFN